MAPALQFLPVDLIAGVAAAPTTTVSLEPVIQIAVSRVQTQISVQWPASHASACGIWLRDLLAVAR